MKFRLLLASLIFLGVGCANKSIIISGTVREAVEADSVQLFLGRKPDCEFEVVAFMQFPGDYFSQSSLIEAFRIQAAELGANALEITDIQKLGATEYMGSARAIRCR